MWRRPAGGAPARRPSGKVSLDATTAAVIIRPVAVNRICVGGCSGAGADRSGSDNAASVTFETPLISPIVIYANESTRNFYDRFMRGEKPKAGWVNDSDFEASAVR